MTRDEARECVAALARRYAFAVSEWRIGPSTSGLILRWEGASVEGMKVFRTAFAPSLAASADFVDGQGEDAWVQAAAWLSGSRLAIRRSDRGRYVTEAWYSVPDFSSLPELELRLQAQPPPEDAAWRALFARFCGAYGIRCQFSDYGDWSRNPCSHSEFWFVRADGIEAGVVVEISLRGGAGWRRSASLEPGARRKGRRFDSENVFRALSGAGVRAGGREFLMPPVAGSAEEYRLRLAAAGVV